MKVYVGTMYRIIVERKCGCRAAQEFKDSAMKEPDGDPTYKPCTKHKRGAMSEVVQEFMLEVLENKAEEHRSKTVIAIAEANATRTDVPAPPVGEGSASETHVPLKVGGKVVQRPTKAGVGVRRSVQPASVADVVTSHKTAAAAITTGNSIDAELAGSGSPAAAEDARITKHLVDASGGLLGPDEEDPSEA